MGYNVLKAVDKMGKGNYKTQTSDARAVFRFSFFPKKHTQDDYLRAFHMIVTGLDSYYKDICINDYSFVVNQLIKYRKKMSKLGIPIPEQDEVIIDQIMDRISQAKPRHY